LERNQANLLQGTLDLLIETEQWTTISRAIASALKANSEAI
jgi:hypothetical protein